MNDNLLSGDDPKRRRKPWARFSIATKLMASFLVVLIISFTIVGLLVVLNMNDMGNFAEESSSTLGDSAARDSTSALEELGEGAMKQKALDVSKQVEIYLESHPGIIPEEMGDMDLNPGLVQIAMQSVGATGYTCLYEKGTGIMRVHPNPDLVNFKMDALSESLPSFWMVFKPSLRGTVFSGYYDWEDADGNMRPKFMYMVPVEDTVYMVAATTYIDEFSQPATATRDRIVEMTTETTKHINGQINNTRNLYIAIFSGVLVVVAGLVFLVSRKITNPIKILSAGARMIGTGNLDHRVQIRTGDEIEELADSFNRMTSDLQTYVRNLNDTTAAKERIESELRIATEIQTSMLPRIFPPYPDREEFDVYATMIPAKEVGGDFYDFFLVAENKFCFIIGDVCGKGVPAALFMAISKTLLKMEALVGYNPAEVLEHVNNTLYPDNDSSMFFTGLCAILNTDTGELCIANAGHNPPLLKSSGGEFGFVELPRGIPIGPMPDIKYQSTCLTLIPGSVLFLYTDGVTEATNIKDELFSEARLQQSVVRLTDNDPVKLVDGARADIEAFVDGADQSDDITIMVLRFNGKEPISGQ